MQLGVGRSGLHEDGTKDGAANLKGFIHRQAHTGSRASLRSLPLLQVII